MWEEIEKYLELSEKAVEEMKKRSFNLAKTKHNYAVALSKRLVELRAEGQAVTHLLDIAKGEPQIAKLRYEKDIAQGLYDSSKEAINVYKKKTDVLKEQYAREWGSCK